MSGSWREGKTYIKMKMKNFYKSRLFVIALFLGLMSFKTLAINYTISFTGSGASTTIDSVVVQNLYKGTQVKVPAGTQLRWYNVETSIDRLNTITDFAYVYPNPMTDNATFSFVAKKDGNTQISVFGIDGRKVTGMDIDLLQGKNSFQLTLPNGVYLVQANGNGFSYSTKIISLSLSYNQPLISYTGNTTSSKPQKAPAAEVKMQYTPGDQILYKGYSGNYCTIVTDLPNQNKTIDFKFVDCTDADGNHYAVVHIGEQTWMAENLKSTKYRNGVEIGTTIPADKDITSETNPKYQWAYVGNESNAAKYGRLYTWYAVADARNIAPEGWRVATDAEWTTLQNYLIDNGYNHDGTTEGNKIAKSLASTTDWRNYSTTGTIGSDLSKNNKSGFTALSGGYRLCYGAFYKYAFGYWWSSTENYTSYAWVRSLYCGRADLGRFYDYEGVGFSVRCIRD